MEVEINRLDREIITIQNALEKRGDEIGSLQRATVMIEGKVEAVMSIAARLGTLEIAMAKHAGVCDERYLRISTHMDDSSRDRAELRRMFRNIGGTIIVMLLGICGYFIMTFGLPGHR